jgi:hypothetical protein
MPRDDSLRSRLMLQGFACDADPGILRSARWLRITPTLSALWIIAATAERSTDAFWVFAIVAGAGAAGWHAFDALFNALGRRLVGADRLPRNPAPRRFAMILAAACAGIAGGLLRAGFVGWGVAMGVVIALAALLVATTHFCVGSWIYRYAVVPLRPMRKV